MLSAIRTIFQKPSAPESVAVAKTPPSSITLRANSPTLIHLGKIGFAIGIEKETDKLFLYEESEKSGDIVSGKKMYALIPIRHISFSRSGDIVIIETDTIFIRFTLLNNNKRYVEIRTYNIDKCSYFATVDPSFSFVLQGHAEYDTLAKLFETVVPPSE